MEQKTSNDRYCKRLFEIFYLLTFLSSKYLDLTISKLQSVYNVYALDSIKRSYITIKTSNKRNQFIVAYYKLFCLSLNIKYKEINYICIGITACIVIISGFNFTQLYAIIVFYINMVSLSGKAHPFICKGFSIPLFLYFLFFLRYFMNWNTGALRLKITSFSCSTWYKLRSI